MSRVVFYHQHPVGGVDNTHIVKHECNTIHWKKSESYVTSLYIVHVSEETCVGYSAQLYERNCLSSALL